MSALTTAAVIATALGAALIGGVFFAFSSFVMPALAKLAPPQGIAAMQSINVVVINRSFLGAFFGTGVLSVVLAVIGAVGSPAPQPLALLVGGALYLGGTLLVTILGNVPLNDRLAAVTADDEAAVPVWQDYCRRWTRLNTLRAAAAMLAALALVFGLLA